MGDFTLVTFSEAGDWLVGTKLCSIRKNSGDLKTDLTGIKVMNICLIVEWSIIQMVF